MLKETWNDIGEGTNTSNACDAMSYREKQPINQRKVLVPSKERRGYDLIDCWNNHVNCPLGLDKAYPNKPGEGKIRWCFQTTRDGAVGASPKGSNPESAHARLLVPRRDASPALRVKRTVPQMRRSSNAERLTRLGKVLDIASPAPWLRDDKSRGLVRCQETQQPRRQSITRDRCSSPLTP
jgi:hypothetical protein